MMRGAKKIWSAVVGQCRVAVGANMSARLSFGVTPLPRTGETMNRNAVVSLGALVKAQREIRRRRRVALLAVLLCYAEIVSPVRAQDPLPPPAPAIAHPQDSTEKDKSRLAAHARFAEGRRLLGEATAVSLRKAVEKFQESLPLWRAIGDRRAEALTLTYIGKAYDALGEKAKAQDFYERALPVLRASGDRAGEAATLNNIGLIHDSRGEKLKALDYYDRALPLLRAAGDRRVEAYVLSNIGLVYDSLGEKQKALDFYARALPLLKEVNDQSGIAVTLNNVGFVYDSLGEKRKALGFYEQALPVLRAIGERRVEAVTLNNIGYVHESLGENQKALDYFNRALPVLREVGDRRVEAVTLNNIGLIHRSAGDSQQALRYFAEALALRRAVGDRGGEAVTLNDTGAAYASAGEPLKALDHYGRALALSRAVGDRAVEAAALRGTAHVARGRGDLAEARARIEEALRVVESLRTEIVNWNLRTSYFASAQKYFESYIDILMRSHQLDASAGYDRAAFEASERARARGLLETLAEARADIRGDVDPSLVERQRALRRQLNSHAERQMRLADGGALSANQSAELKKQIEGILTEHDEVETHIRIRNPRYAALTQPAPLSLSEVQQSVLDPETLLLEYALGDEKSYLWAVTPDSVKSFALPPRAEVEALARRVYELLTTRHRRVKFETAEERRTRVAAADAAYARASAELSRMILGPIAPQLRGRRLLIVSDGALQYVPFAALPVVRAEGGEMRDEKRPAGSNSHPSSLIPPPLIVEHEILSLPSASTLAVLRREIAGRRQAPRTLAVIADPVFTKDDERVGANSVKRKTDAPRTRGAAPEAVVSFADARAMAQMGAPVGDAAGPISRLPFTRREAEEVLALVPPTERLKAFDFDANRATATSAALSQYRYIHFATHGVLNSEHPELSGIVLSLVDRRGAAQDGFLWAHEVYNLRLPAELVVLSGCRTGLGKEVKGEGLIGLTRGFMYAGAARVVVSLWDVSDEASAELMARFYKGMLGPEQLRPAAALRAAQVAIWQEKRWQSPYYWAAFVLQGEPK